MGETKETKTKVVEMKPTVGEMPKRERTYEEVVAENNQIKQQAEMMYRQIQQMNMQNIFKRLEFLFKVVENRGAFPEEFKNKCVFEIVNLLTIPENKDEEETKNEQAQ